MRRLSLAAMLMLMVAGCGEGAAGEASSGVGAGGGASGSANGGSGGAGAASSGSGGASAASGGAGGAGGGAPVGWQARAPMPGGARQETAVAELDGKIYVVGGLELGGTTLDRVEVYDPESDNWTEAAALPAPRHHVNLAGAGGKLYVVGSLAAGFVAQGDVWIYDPAADEWSDGTDMASGSERGASGVGVVGATIIVAGGFRGVSVADASRYDVGTQQWQSLPDLPAPLDHLVGGAIDGVFFAVGGRSNGVSDVQDELVALAEGAWETRAPMPTPRGGCMAAVVAGRLHVVGGEGNAALASGVFPQHEAYEPSTDSWSTLEAMLTPRHGTGAATVGDVMFVPGGALADGLEQTSAIQEAYFPGR